MEREPISENLAEKLQQELAMRGQYYFKDFGMILSDLLANLEIFAHPDGEATLQRAEVIRYRLKTITDLYAAISFDQITDHPDFDLLVTIKDAISHLHPAAENIINGEKDIIEAESVIAVIHQNGQAYRVRLHEILNDLRQQPGHEHDGLRAVDIIDGRVWNSAI